MEEILPFNKFFSDCQTISSQLRHVSTKLCDGAQMAIFGLIFASCIFSEPHNSHYGHTMCESMVDIQSLTAEIRRGKNE